jgi:hypothetical protein
LSLSIVVGGLAEAASFVVEPDALPLAEVSDFVLSVCAWPLTLPVADDCVDVAPWLIVDDEFTSVEDWLADTPLDTLWSPEPTFTPGLTFAPTLTSVLLTPTLASTPTFGLTFTPDVLLLVPVAVEDDWSVDTPWLMVDVEFVSVDVWFALALLETLWSPPPVLTPGLTFAPAFTSLLPTPTLAPTPTFGLTFVVSLVVCAPAGATASSAAAVIAAALVNVRLMIRPPCG